MKNFSYIEEQKLLKKIKKIHELIFSLPAKRYVFCVVDPVMAGTVGYAYDVLGYDDIANTKVINFKNLDKFVPRFGDKLIIVYCDCDLVIDNDIEFINEPLNDFQDHVSIVTKINFLYYRQYIQLYRECIENFESDSVSVTQIRDFEEIAK